MLPTSEEERQNLRRDDSLASEFDRRVEELGRQFDPVSQKQYLIEQGPRIFCDIIRGNTESVLFLQLSWLLAVNLGWEGGVHVQTCGHHLHLDCLKSYLKSLRGQQRQQSLAVDRYGLGL
jgi:E3 ubiquitin-protein ligase UBR3